MNKIKKVVRNVVLGMLLVSQFSIGYAMPTRTVKIPDIIGMSRCAIEYMEQYARRIDVDFQGCVQPLIVLGLADMITEPVCKHNPVIRFCKRVIVIGGVIYIARENISIKK
jgi:hypothetical protein